MTIGNESIQDWLGRLVTMQIVSALPFPTNAEIFPAVEKEEVVVDDITTIATATLHLRDEQDDAEAAPTVEYDMARTHDKYYGKPPHIEWSYNKTRQATTEKRINRLVNRMKAFYLTVTKLDDTIEEWYVDGGNWVTKLQPPDYKFGKLVGHARNILPFFIGRRLKVGRK